MACFHDQSFQALSKKEGDVPSGDTCEDDVEENHESNSAAVSNTQLFVKKCK